MRNRKYTPASGDRFGEWTVIGEAIGVRYPSTNGVCRRIRVQCVCGRQASVSLYALVREYSTRCYKCSAIASRKVLTIQGVTAFLMDVLRDNGISRDLYDQRRHRGMTMEAAATRPVCPCRRPA